MKVEHAAPSSPLLTSPPVAGGISALSLVAALGLLVGIGASTVDVPPAVSLVLFVSLSRGVHRAQRGDSGARWPGGRNCNGTSGRPSASSAR